MDKLRQVLSGNDNASTDERQGFAAQVCLFWILNHLTEKIRRTHYNYAYYSRYVSFRVSLAYGNLLTHPIVSQALQNDKQRDLFFETITTVFFLLLPALFQNADDGFYHVEYG